MFCQMENEKQLKPVEGRKAFEELRTRLESVDAPIACGIGFVNRIRQLNLTTPEFWVNKGKPMYEPLNEVPHGMASPCVFVNQSRDEDSSGCITYDIGTTKLVLAAMWLTGSNGNRFSVRVMPQRECNENLYSELYDQSVAQRTKDTLVRDENGFRVQARMTEGTHCVLIIECMSLICPLEKARTYPQGSELRSQCQKLANGFKDTNCCVVGVENDLVYRGNHLGHPRTLEESGKCVLDPADVIEPGMGSPMLFSKREFALKGSSGCVSYDIGDTDLMLVIKWVVPEKELSGQNRFNIHITQRKELSRELSKEMEGDWMEAKQGKIRREESSFTIEATMTEEEKAAVYVKISS